jgi:hypothetical protein
MRTFTETQVTGTITAGTIIRPFGGERFDVEAVETTTYGEIRFVNWYGEKLIMSDSLHVEILGRFNPSGPGQL